METLAIILAIILIIAVAFLVICIEKLYDYMKYVGMLLEYLAFDKDVEEKFGKKKFSPLTKPTTNQEKVDITMKGWGL